MNIDDSTVYTGYWVDHSRDAVHGATITLSGYNGNMLVSFIAFLVTIASSSFWTILSFALHQCLFTRRYSDGLFRQLLVALRNTGGPFSTGVELIKLGIAWRRHGKRHRGRITSLVIVAVLHLVFFTAAMLLSSKVTQTSSKHVLLRSDTCGYVQSNATTDQLESVTQAATVEAQITLLASDYARVCYGQNVTNSLQACNTYAVSQIRSTTRSDAPCPFAAGTCLYGPNQAFEIDTGFVDSHEAFGINAPASDRVLFRYKATCAVMRDSDRTRTFDYYSQPVPPGLRAGQPGDLIQAVYFGQIIGDFVPYTFSWNNHTRVDSVGYQLDSVSDNYGWNPLPDYVRNDGSSSLYFLAQNKIHYMQPVRDPWFNAEMLDEKLLSVVNMYSKYNATLYKSASNFSTLGCLDQVQLCNPNDGQSPAPTNCTPLSHNYRLRSAASDLAFNKQQNITATRLEFLGLHANIYRQVWTRQQAALLSNMGVIGDFYEDSLPENQWQIEVQNWFNTGLAKMQYLGFLLNVGPGTMENKTRINESQGLGLCRQQIIGNTYGYLNFSVLGLSIVIGVVVLLVILSLFIPSAIGSLQKRTKTGDRRRVQWNGDEKHQLLRMAAEGAGYGPWNNGFMAVPVSCDDMVEIGELSEARNLPFVKAGHRERLAADEMCENQMSSSARLMGQYDPASRDDHQSLLSVDPTAPLA